MGSDRLRLTRAHGEERTRLRYSDGAVTQQPALLAVRASMRGLSRAVASVSQKFDTVSQNRYSDLSVVHRNIVERDGV